jgi:hypothetical protein
LILPRAQSVTIQFNKRVVHESKTLKFAILDAMVMDWHGTQGDLVSQPPTPYLDNENAFFTPISSRELA